MKKQIGITLVALVVTIIVLLILAGVSISLVVGNNGVINQANHATAEYKKASAEEKFNFLVFDYETRIKTGQLYGETTVRMFLDECIERGEISSVEIIANVDENNDDTDGAYNYINAGKYLVKIDDYEFIMPYEDVAVDVTTENIIGENGYSRYMDFEKTTTGDFAANYCIDNYAYPVAIYRELQVIKVKYVKFYIKTSTETEFEQTKVKWAYGNNTSEFYILKDIGSAAETIAFPISDLNEIYTLKVEYIMEDGSRIYCTYETPEGLCFVAGTKVLTENGLINIEEIKQGMQVYSRNLETGENELKTVLATSRNTKQVNTYRIDIRSEYIESTAGHPYYEKVKGFTKAKDLVVGDILVDIAGNEFLVENIEIIENNELITVYNLNVEDNHNYFVGENKVLVHNAEPCKT